MEMRRPRRVSVLVRGPFDKLRVPSRSRDEGAAAPGYRVHLPVGGGRPRGGEGTRRPTDPSATFEKVAPGPEPPTGRCAPGYRAIELLIVTMKQPG